jgi:hypothetical protein
MTRRSAPKPESKMLDKAMLRQAVAALEKRMGFIQNLAATAEQVQALLRARGVRPEDRFLSSEIIQMRREQAEGT